MRLVRWWIYLWVAIEIVRKLRKPTTLNIAAISAVLKEVWTDVALEGQFYGDTLLWEQRFDPEWITDVEALDDLPAGAVVPLRKRRRPARAWPGLPRMRTSAPQR